MAVKPKKTTPVKRLKKKVEPSRQMQLFDAIVNAESDDKRKEIAQTIRTMLELQKLDTTQWRGLVATPPRSYLERILECFYTKTNIPLEIPFFAGLHCLSAYLLKRGCYINFKGQKIKPDLWSVILAQSGAGKTFASNAVTGILGIEGDFSNPASSARFVEELERNNNGFWVRDEFLELLKAIETQPQLAEMKDYLLRLYDGKKIERITKKDEFVIHDPALVIFGTTVLETFIRSIPPESLVDGFAQRFNYVIAKNDPSRKMTDFALYDLSEHKEGIKNSWDDMIQNIEHEEYEFSENAEAGFKSAFALLNNIEIPESFYRRVMFRGIKYALMYHVILGKRNNIIDEVDMGWAGRLCAMHLKDVGKLIEGHEQTDLQNLLTLCSNAVERLRDKGKPITPRNLIFSVNRIKNVAEARAMLAILNEG